MISELYADIERDLCRRPNIFQFVKYILFKRCFQTVLLYRIRHKLDGHRFFGKINLFLDWLSFFISSCDISSKAEIGKGFYLPHAVGIVIGSGVKIGAYVTIYQNVTLGRKNVAVAEYPTIGNYTTLCCGSAALGSIRIGENCVIAANSVVLIDIDDASLVVGSPGKVIRCS